MNGTTFIEEDTKDRKMHKGFYIDVMCLNNVSSVEDIERGESYVSLRVSTKVRFLITSWVDLFSTSLIFVSKITYLVRYILRLA